MVVLHLPKPDVLAVSATLVTITGDARIIGPYFLIRLFSDALAIRESETSAQMQRLAELCHEQPAQGPEEGCEGDTYKPL